MFQSGALCPEVRSAPFPSYVNSFPFFRANIREVFGKLDSVGHAYVFPIQIDFYADI